MRGHVLLDEGLAADAVGEAPEGDGTVLQVRQHHRGDTGVVVEHGAFGESAGGIEHLVEVRQREALTVDLRLDAIRAHG
jgi:hypothetical protein